MAENSRSTQRLMLPPPVLSASGVFSKFRDIGRLTGSAVSGAGRLTPAPQTLCSSPGAKATCVARGLLVRPSGASALLVGSELPSSHPQGQASPLESLALDTLLHDRTQDPFAE